jgi:hypothetical protein
VKRFWRAFKPYIWQAIIAPAGIVALDVLLALIRWAGEQIAGEAFLTHFDAWARSHNVSAQMLGIVAFAESNPVAASVILAAVAVAYGAVRSEWELRIHPERFPVETAPLPAIIPIAAPAPSQANIVAIRTDDGEILDPTSTSGNVLPVLLATFQNLPVLDVDIGTADTVTASIIYEPARGFGAEIPVFTVVKGLWSNGFLTDNATNFAVNSVRQLVLAAQTEQGVVAFENLSDSQHDRICITHHFNLFHPERNDWIARVRFTINGRLTAKEYVFAMNLDTVLPMAAFREERVLK